MNSSKTILSQCFSWSRFSFDWIFFSPTQRACEKIYYFLSLRLCDEAMHGLHFLSTSCKPLRYNSCKAMRSLDSIPVREAIKLVVKKNWVLFFIKSTLSHYLEQEASDPRTVLEKKCCLPWETLPQPYDVERPLEERNWQRHHYDNTM